MSAKHTPGPWTLYIDPVKGDPFNRMRYEIVAIGKTICRLYHSSYSGGPTNAEDDAKLIAAAPDLLAALEEMLSEKIDYMNRNHLGNPYKEASVQNALAAIVRATGEQA